MTPERLTELERTSPKNPIVQELVSAVRDAQAQVNLLHAGKGILPETFALSDQFAANAHANGTCEGPPKCPVIGCKDANGWGGTGSPL